MQGVTADIRRRDCSWRWQQQAETSSAQSRMVCLYHNGVDCEIISIITRTMQHCSITTSQLIIQSTRITSKNIPIRTTEILVIRRHFEITTTVTMESSFFWAIMPNSQWNVNVVREENITFISGPMKSRERGQRERKLQALNCWSSTWGTRNILGDT